MTCHAVAFASTLPGMSKPPLHELLSQQHVNLTELARRSGVHIRTLFRLKAGEYSKPHRLTDEAIRKTLKKLPAPTAWTA